MKIFKERRHALFNRPIQVAGVDYLSIGVMLYFDLTAPDELHTEQELWKELVALMGTDLVLDQGWPKPHGEVLMAGAAVAAGGRPTPAAQVRLRCGPVDKTLRIFGDRFWVEGPLGMSSLTDPAPFTRMPIDWKHAFGGPDFKDNPLGKGIAPAKQSDGIKRIPLPNVEAQPLVGSPEDRPPPASFGPLDIMWPARAKKNGTYDDAWLKQRWPALPDDMNYELFCMAPEDQYLPGHFEGQEVIEIAGMHKDLPVIRSHLPQRRVRAFVTRRDQEHPEDLASARFEEVGLKPETLWLFPEILRGVILWRGLARCADDEYSDLARLMVKDEDAADAPTAIEVYRDEQLKKADLGVPFDPAMQARFQREMAKGAKRVLNLPKALKAATARQQQQAPVMTMSQEDVARTLTARLVQIRATIDSGESTARGLHERFGHLVPVDLDAFVRARGQADKMEAQISSMVAKGKAMEARKAEMLGQAKDVLRRPAARPLLEKAGIPDPEQCFEQPPEPSFHARGFPLLCAWRMGLLEDPARMRALTDMGLERETVKNRWLAWNPEPREERASDWGLEAKPGQETFTLPAGLILPRFDGAKLSRLLCRPGETDAPSTDWLVPGSATEPLFLEAASEQKVLALVADELSAAYVEQEAGDFAHVAVCEAPTGPLPKAASASVQQGAIAVVVVPELGSWAGQEHAFSAALPGCRFARLPGVRDLFAAHRKGLDVRQAIVDQLPPDQAQAHALLFDAPGAPPKPGAKKLADILSAASIAGLIKDGVAQVKTAKEASFKPRIAELQQKAEEGKARLSAKGFQPPEPPPSTGPRPMTEELTERANQVQAIRDKLQAKGMLPPEKDAELNQVIARLRQLGPQLDAQKSEQLGKLHAFAPPEQAQAALAKAGLDPAKLKPQPPERVLAAAKGQGDVCGATIKGLDFSGQDLSGIDLSKARVSECLFKGSKLSGATLNAAIIEKCDFTGADLTASQLDRAVIKSSTLDAANLARCRGEMTIIQQSSLKSADLSATDFQQLMVQKTPLTAVNLDKARLSLCVFDGGDGAGLTANNARFEKCVLKRLAMDKASFLGITTDALLLHGCSGEQVNFTGSDLFKFRISHDSSVPGIVLRDVTWKQGYCRASNLAGADFQGASIERTIFDSCDLTAAQFSKVRLYRCRFPKSDLEAATLRFANLMMSSLRHARLVQADLRGANCYAVDFFRAKFGNTKLAGANLKRSLIDGREQAMRDQGMIV